MTRGVTVTDGADLRLSDISLVFDANNPTAAQPSSSVTVHLRTDMWPYWLAEAIDAAVDAATNSAQIPAAVADGVERVIGDLMLRELRAAMRAITAAAFAVDAFYAAIKARSPEHPNAAQWQQNRLARHKQVFETFRQNLKLDNATSKEASRRISQLFAYRDWAVHPGSEFKEPIYRPDLDASADWHFTVFRAENALAAVAMTVQMLDRFTPRLERGSTELAEWRPKVRKAINRVLDQYEAAAALPTIGRGEPLNRETNDPPPPASEHG